MACSCWWAKTDRIAARPWTLLTSVFPSKGGAYVTVLSNRCPVNACLIRSHMGVSVSPGPFPGSPQGGRGEGRPTFPFRQVEPLGARVGVVGNGELLHGP